MGEFHQFSWKITVHLRKNLEAKGPSGSHIQHFIPGDQQDSPERELQEGHKGKLTYLSLVAVSLYMKFSIK